MADEPAWRCAQPRAPDNGREVSTMMPMMDLTTQFTAARKVTHRDDPPRFLVWITRAGATMTLEVEARNSAEAKERAAAELLEAERLFSSI